MTISKITFAGHSAVLFQIDQQVVAIDPWLMGNPMCPEQLKQPERLDLIVLSHGHSDHASDVVALAQRYKCKVAATFELASLLQAAGVAEDLLIYMNKGGKVTINQLDVRLTHALHSNSYDTEDGPRYAGEACGVILSSGGQTVYHAGDTALFSDMALIARLYAPQTALLPIGDCFTMGPREAAEAARILGVDRVIPIHYKTFPPLTGTVEEFQKALKGASIDVVVLEPGESFSL